MERPRYAGVPAMLPKGGGPDASTRRLWPINGTREEMGSARVGMHEASLLPKSPIRRGKTEGRGGKLRLRKGMKTSRHPSAVEVKSRPSSERGVRERKEPYGGTLPFKDLKTRSLAREGVKLLELFN